MKPQKRDPYLAVYLPEEKREELTKLAAKKGLKPVPYVRQLIYEDLAKAIA